MNSKDIEDIRHFLRSVKRKESWVVRQLNIDEVAMKNLIINSMRKEQELLMKNVEENKQIKSLKKKMLTNDFRKIVAILYTERGYSANEFASELGFFEKDIIDIANIGICSDKLLDEICKYFSLIKTEQVMKSMAPEAAVSLHELALQN